MAARFGHGEQGEHGMVASHVAAGGGQIAKIGTFKIQGETGSGFLRLVVTVSYTPTAQ
mgnify:CR=1 FL=1